MENLVLKNLGRIIRQYRKQKRPTQEMLGDKAGICPKYLGEIERGETNPTVTIINKIATALEQDMANFLDTKPNQEKISYLGKINSLLEEKDEATLSDIAKVLEILVGQKKT